MGLSTDFHQEIFDITFQLSIFESGGSNRFLPVGMTCAYLRDLPFPGNNYVPAQDMQARLDAVKLLL